MSIVIIAQVLLTLALVSFCVVYGTSLASMLDEMRGYQAINRATVQLMRDELDAYNGALPDMDKETIVDTHTNKQAIADYEPSRLDRSELIRRATDTRLRLGAAVLPPADDELQPDPGKTDDDDRPTQRQYE